MSIYRVSRTDSRSSNGFLLEVIFSETQLLRNYHIGINADDERSKHSKISALGNISFALMPQGSCLCHFAHCHHGQVKQENSMLGFFAARKNVEKEQLATLTAELARLRSIEELQSILGAHSGVGLWDAILFERDAMSPKSKWTWSAEFRRLLGFAEGKEFPDLVTSWSDRLHPDDAGPTFAAFSASCVRR
jgi:hypothetical protein